jgi:hypothetical protein
MDEDASSAIRAGVEALKLLIRRDREGKQEGNYGT